MLAMNVIKRVLAVIRVWSVGQVSMGAVVDVGVYPYSEIPELVKSVPNMETSSSSEFTSSSVTTSLGLLSIQYFMSVRKVRREPPSRSVQVVWQSSSVPFRLCTWACRSRIPAERAVVAL